MASTPPQASTRTTPGAGPTLWVPLLIVLAAAAALSFDALHDLAVAVHIPPPLAPMLPIAIDAGAAGSCATWLSRRVDHTTARFARRMTLVLLVLTVIGNAAQLGMHANDVAPPWWVAVVVGTVPPAVVGATVHLIVLATRSRDDLTPATPTVIDMDIRQRAQRLVASGAGRPRIATELGLTDHQARRLVREIRRATPGRPHDGHEPTPAMPQDDHAGAELASYSSLARPDAAPINEEPGVTTWSPNTTSSCASASCSPRPKRPEH